jgi:hypothetical protein
VSDASPLERRRITTLWNGTEFVELYVTFQMQNTGDGEGYEAADADMFFDRVDGENFTCAELSFDFKTFPGSQGTQCYDVIEGDYTAAAYDFDFSSEFDDETMPISLEKHQPTKVQTLNFNITYTGDTVED